MTRSPFRRAAPLLCLLAPATCAAAGPAGAAAPATLRATTLGPVAGLIIADGDRWAAWQPDASTTRILDARTGTLTDVAVPEACRERTSQTVGAGSGSGRGLTAIGGGQLAWTCATTGTVSTYPTLLDLTTMTAHLPAGLATLLQPVRDGYYRTPCVGPWTGLGTRWVRAACYGDKSDFPLDLDWRRGTVAPMAPALARRTVGSLDTVTRTRTICAPVLVARRRTQSGIRGSRADGPLQAAGWVVGTTPVPGPLVMQRCGTRRLITLSACPRFCAVGTLTGGWLAWTSTATTTSGGLTRARQVGSRTLGRTIVLRPTASGAPVAAGRVLLDAAGPFGGRVVRIWRLPGAPRLPGVPGA